MIWNYGNFSRWNVEFSKIYKFNKKKVFNKNNKKSDVLEKL